MYLLFHYDHGSRTSFALDIADLFLDCIPVTRLYAFKDLNVFFAMDQVHRVEFWNAWKLSQVTSMCEYHGV
jgi:hypothetical protein